LTHAERALRKHMEEVMKKNKIQPIPLMDEGDPPGYGGLDPKGEAINSTKPLIDLENTLENCIVCVSSKNSALDPPCYECLGKGGVHYKPKTCNNCGYWHSAPNIAPCKEGVCVDKSNWIPGNKTNPKKETP